MHLSPQLSWTRQSGLAPFPGCQGSCGILPNGLADSVVFFNIRQGLKYYKPQHRPEPCDLSYVLIAPFLEPQSKVVSTFRGNLWQLFGCILIDRSVTKQHSLLGPRPSAEFSGKMCKFLISLADFLLTLAFLYCHDIFDYISCHHSFNTAV